jgi:predicted adenine nucleotide alpha hydrolase (AANH) superfamily ATPase
LLKKDYDVTGYFYNPNIFPPEEYRLRLEEARKVAGIVSCRLIEGKYDNKRWLALTRKFAAEPEKGRRCHICYAWRLRQTAIEAREQGFEMFTTILSLSPWKRSDVINRIGKMFGRRHSLAFLEADFKKKGGFEKSVELSRRHHLYRQNYCGCPYSQRR